MGYAFGKSFDYFFYPLVNNEAVGAIPNQNPDVYIFTDAQGQPSRQLAAAGTGALQVITNWTVVDGGFKIAIDAINDPEPLGSTSKRIFWIAINYILKSGGQVQTTLRALELERVSSHSTRVGLTATDLTTLFPELSSFVTTNTINAAISLAEQECKSILLNKGYEWAQIKSPERLKLAMQARAMMQIMINQRKSPGDNFDANYTEYKKQYKSYLDSIK